MKISLLLPVIVMVLSSTPADAQQRLAEPALQISREVQLADQQIRDINELKQQMASFKQSQAVQQEQIFKLRACVKQLDTELAGSRTLHQTGQIGELVQQPVKMATSCNL